MVNITRFDPLEDAFENLVRGIPMWLPVPETRASVPTQLRMDVTENDKEYQVLAELRGSEARKKRKEWRDYAARRALLRQNSALGRARAGGGRSGRAGQIQ